MYNVGITTGRFQGCHKGHELLLKKMIDDFGYNNSLCLVACTGKVTTRNPFTFKQVKRFLTTLFPKLKIVGIADMNNPEQWLAVQDSIIDSIFFNIENLNPLHYVGTTKDVSFYINQNRNLKVVDRDNLPISGTLVRDYLKAGKPVENFISDKICSEVIDTYRQFELK